MSFTGSCHICGPSASLWTQEAEAIGHAFYLHLFVALGMEPGASHVLAKCSATEPSLQPASDVLAAPSGGFEVHTCGSPSLLLSPLGTLMTGSPFVGCHAGGAQVVRCYGAADQWPARKLSLCPAAHWEVNVPCIHQVGSG